MAKTVQRDVFVHHPTDPNKSRWFRPGEELTTWAEAEVTNKRVFEAPDEDEGEELFDPEEGQNYTELKIDELKALLAERGLEAKGNRADLIERLQEHDATVG
jgi:hypothetical protein